MDLSQTNKYRKVLVPCRQCGRAVHNKRKGPEVEFCSEACRSKYRRTSEFRSKYGWTQPHGPTGVGENRPAKSITSKDQNRGRASRMERADWPLDLVGGRYRGGTRPNVDAAVRRIILATEIRERRK